MGRRKKNPSEENLNSGELFNNNEDTTPAVVELQIENHDSREPDGLIERAKKKLTDLGRETIAASDAPSNKKETKWQKYNRSKTAKENQQREDIAALVSTVLSLGIALWSVPSDLKPNNDEVETFGGHLAGIVYRHTPIGALSEDVLDLVGMVAVIGVYLTRTADARRLYSASHKNNGGLPPGGPSTPLSRPIPPGTDFEHTDQRISPTPIEALAPDVGRFLSEAKKAYESDEDFHS